MTGVMTRPRDPIRLGRMLARYRFVADMLDARRDVAEYGCVEAFGSALVQTKARKLTIYDPDSAMLADLHPQSGEGTPVLAQVHDVLGDPLPMRHDAIYCLDAIERIARDDEDAFVRNLARSLSFDHALLIVGSEAAVQHVPREKNRGADALANRAIDEYRAKS